MYDSRRPNSSQRSSQHMESSPREDYYLEEKQKNSPPRNGWIYSIIIGLVGGIIALAIPVAIVLINASLYREEARLGENTPYQIVATISLWQCSAVFVDLLLAFFVGMIAGRITVRRRLGVLAGALVGGIVFLGIFFIHYIPGYPEIISGSAKRGDVGTGIAFSIVLFMVWTLVGGLMGLWGAWVTKRRHPHYRSRQQE